MRYVADRSLRIVDDGRVLIGGSPLRLIRLTERGAALVADLLAGGERPLSAAEKALVDRLSDGGLLHPHPTTIPAPSISVVIPTRDRRVEDLIWSLPMPDEVIVVDDGSVPPLEVSVGGAQLRVLRHPTPRGPAAARNSGWRAATGEVVVFLDSDCVPSDGWLAPLLGHFCDPRVSAVASRVQTVADDGVLDRYEALRSPLDLGAEPGRVAAGSRVSYVPSAALAVRRSALEAAGGFDEAMRFGEDVDLVWRLVSAGASVRYEPASVVNHPPRSGIGEWMRQRFGYGTSAAPLALRHRGAVSPMRVSAWSVVAWALGAVAPGGGAVLAVVTAAMFPRKLRMLRHPWREGLRLALAGHALAGRQMADAIVRAWWPLAVLASLLSPRARRVVLAAAVVPHALEWAQRRPRIDPLRWVALRILDDASYGAGLWWGCLSERTADPLLPNFVGAAAVATTDPAPPAERSTANR